MTETVTAKTDRAAREPLEVVVGVTGHRSKALEGKDLNAIAAQIRYVLEQIRRSFADASSEDGSDTPLVVLTSIAEGADRMVAWEAMKKSPTRLQVLLPLERDDYES